jgi:hypothetical protein
VATPPHDGRRSPHPREGIARDEADEAVTHEAPTCGHEVRRMVADSRDRALLSIGFVYGFRRSELLRLT